jgi:hypothetical protein
MKLLRYILILLIIQSFCLNSYAHKKRWDDYKSEWSDLMIAIYKGKNKKVKKLIERGVAINFRTPIYKLNAIEVAIRKENEIAIAGLCIWMQLLSNSRPHCHVLILAKSKYEFNLIYLCHYLAINEKTCFFIGFYFLFHRVILST